jgi:hypothetical protein
MTEASAALPLRRALPSVPDVATASVARARIVATAPMIVPSICEAGRSDRFVFISPRRSPPRNQATVRAPRAELRRVRDSRHVPKDDRRKGQNRARDEG